MPLNPAEMEGTVKKELHIFYVLDTSGSMTGAPIGALNDAMKATLDELRKKDGEDADFYIAAMEFNTKNRWITKGNNGLEPLADCVWTDVSATGMTYLAGALRELNQSLSRNSMMKAATGNKLPVVIFMSDGYPNDSGDTWEKALDELAQNKWYRNAIKVAFALGDQAAVDVLAKVVGVRTDGSIMPNYEAVIKTNDLDIFSNMIVAVSATASLAASQSTLTNQTKSGEDVVEEVTGGIPASPTEGVVVNKNDIPDPYGPAMASPPNDDFGDDFGDVL